MSDEWRFVEDFAAVDPLQWFRIMPVGKFSKFGRTIEITDQTIQDMVGNFRIVPPTRLPVNVEHMDEHGKFGDIAALRAIPGDGLYAIIDWTAAGMKLLDEQRFQYYSPEIIFGAQEYEGRMIKNILYGLALTNHPYFGNDTALFSTKDVSTGAPGAGPFNDIDESQGETSMDEAKVADGLFARFREMFSANPQPAPAPIIQPVAQDVVTREEFDALAAKLNATEQAKAAIEQTAAQSAEAIAFSARVDKFKALLPDLPTLAEKFAAIADEALAEELAQDFKALNAQQSTAALFDELGTSGGDLEGKDGDKFMALVDAKVKAGAKFNDALKEVGREHPAMAEAYRRESIERNKGR